MQSINLPTSLCTLQHHDGNALKYLVTSPINVFLGIPETDGFVVFTAKRQDFDANNFQADVIYQYELDPPMAKAMRAAKAMKAMKAVRKVAKEQAFVATKAMRAAKAMKAMKAVRKVAKEQAIVSTKAMRAAKAMKAAKAMSK